MHSESTKKLEDLFRRLTAEYREIPECQLQTAYAKALNKARLMIFKEAELSCQMDEAKSYARCY